ncbi:MAG: histidine phosphatase family protein [Bacilli bacterium]|nr:histidine phosphatase family protein [Bacilli bacterium]
MDLYLIRHGESTQNTKENFCDRLPDHIVPLTDNGIIQCEKAGFFLKQYLEDNNINIQNAVMWVSPFLRTRQSAKLINEYLNVSDVREDYLLIEQRYGLFSDRSVLRNKMLFKDEFDFYDNYYQNDGKFYAKMPQGESSMDVAIRTRQFLDMISSLEKNPVFVVSHGTTIRTIVMNTFNYSPEWFNRESTMENCSIRLVNKEDKIDKYIYGGKIKRLK